MKEMTPIANSRSPNARPLTRATDVILRAVSPDSPRSRHVVVDMTPLEGNGQNGGAGLVAVSLVRHLSALSPDTQFTLLTAEGSHAELAPLDRPNVHRQRVVTTAGARSLARQLVDRLMPPKARVRLKHAYRSVRISGHHHRLTAGLQPSLLFYPFTVPYFWRPGTPSIAIVY